MWQHEKCYFSLKITYFLAVTDNFLYFCALLHCVYTYLRYFEYDTSPNDNSFISVFLSGLFW